MKRILSFIVFFVLICGGASADNEIINIGLYYGNSAKSSVNITADGASKIYYASDITNDIAISSSSGTVSVEGTAYKGSIILKKDSNGQITVINQVDIEDYIASVIAKEMSPSFNMEALKAQAVCARTYALKNMGKHKNNGFDLCSSNDCQVYPGASAETQSTVSAAQQTKGQLIRYNGSIIDAVYFATSGGYTEDVKNVWGSDLPYLKAVPDTYESKDVYGSTWTKELTAQQATDIMARKGYNIGAVTDIKVLEQTEHGVVTKLQVIGTAGEKTFTNEGCRLAFGSVTLSQAFTIKNPTSDAKVNAYGGGEIDLSKASFITSSGVSSYGGQALVLRGNTDKAVSANVNKDVIIFDGRGFGHLVGLSQNGANGMAAAGFGYKDILTHYYQGTEIY